MASNSPENDDDAAFAAVSAGAHAVRMDALGVVIDSIVEADRELATIAACRAELIEQARQLSVADAIATAEEAGRSVHHTGNYGWSPLVTAHREVISEIACALRIPERTASTLVEHSQALVETLPATLAALSAGDISYRHAQLLADHAATLPTDALAGFENTVLPHAKELTVAKFDRKARIERERSHPDTISERVTIARERRSIGWEPARDGMAWLSAYLPAETVIGSYNRIDDIAVSLQGEDETRTLTQLRADVFTDLLIDGTTDPHPDPHPDADAASAAADLVPAHLMDTEFDVLLAMQLGIADYTGINLTLDTLANQITTDATNPIHANTNPGTGTDAGDAPPITTNDRAPTTRTRASRNGIGHGIRARVLVTVPVLTLLGHTDEPGTLEGYGPIDPDTATQLAAEAPSFTRLLTHPETGAVLSVGRDSYTVPADLRLWLRIRDETCRHPGCNKNARRCDLDHTTDWQHHGRTQHDNLAHLCPTHHHLKHHTAWTVQHLDAGALDWTSPTGKTYSTHAARTMRTPQSK